MWFFRSIHFYFAWVITRKRNSICNIKSTNEIVIIAPDTNFTPTWHWQYNIILGTLALWFSFDFFMVGAPSAWLHFLLLLWHFIRTNRNLPQKSQFNWCFYHHWKCILPGLNTHFILHNFEFLFCHLFVIFVVVLLFQIYALVYSKFENRFSDQKWNNSLFVQIITCMHERKRRKEEI